MAKTYRVKGTLHLDVEWEVQAESEDEALEKFYSTDARDIVDECAITDVSSENEEAELIEATYKVKVTNIDYDVDWEHAADVVEEKFPNISYDSDEFAELVDKEIEKIKEKLPHELIIEVTCRREDLEDYIVDEITDRTNWLVNNYSYEIEILEEN